MEGCSHPARALQCVVKHYLLAALPLDPPVPALEKQEAWVVCQACGGVWGVKKKGYLSLFARAIEGRNAQIVHQGL